MRKIEVQNQTRRKDQLQRELDTLTSTYFKSRKTTMGLEVERDGALHRAQAVEERAAHLATNLKRLADFLAARYPHQAQDGELAVDAAVRLLTPGDGSEAAWQRMAAARNVSGEARRRLEAVADEVLASPEVQVGVRERVRRSVSKIARDGVVDDGSCCGGYGFRLASADAHGGVKWGGWCDCEAGAELARRAEAEGLPADGAGWWGR